MTLTNANIYVCDTLVNAEAARLVLVGLGFGQITIDKVANFVEYDAKTYGGGGTRETPDTANYVVIGKQE